MTVISHSIVIQAPAAIVWSTLTDTARYGSWNPFIPELAGELRPGTKLRVRISPPGGRAMTFKPTVIDVAEERHLEWLGRMGVPGLFDGRHSFTLDPVDSTTTRLTQAENFVGLLVPFADALLRRTAAGFQAMNEALAIESTARFAVARNEAHP
jgi:hypothetical protein